MSSYQSAVVTVGIQVTRKDSEWIPFDYHMFYCRQREANLADWASHLVNLLGVLGGVPGERKMKVGESRRYWARIRLTYTQNYWGEGDEDVEFLKVRRIK